jgi:hypothetical protein
MRQRTRVRDSRTGQSSAAGICGLLSAAERALFARLGVFAGTFGLPAAEAVCGDAGNAALPVMDTLSSLVHSSLVRAEARGDEPRFSLLETIREYAMDLLRDSGDWKEVHDRHAAYFLALAKPAEAELCGAGQLAWLDRLEIRHGNLNAAVSWLVDQDQIAPALDLIWATWRFWWLRDHAEELTRYVDQILAKSSRLPSAQRALALSGAAFVHLPGGDETRARRLLKQSLPLYRQVGDRLGMGLTASALGHLMASQHEYARAIDLLEQTLGQLRVMAGERLTGPDRVWYLLDVALASNFLGQIWLGQGDRQRAAELFTYGDQVRPRAPAGRQPCKRTAGLPRRAGHVLVLPAAGDGARRRNGPGTGRRAGQRRGRVTGGGQRRQAGEGGALPGQRAQIEEVGQVVGVGVAVGEGREVPFPLDRGQDRGVVVEHLADVVASGVRGHHDRRDAEPVPCEAVVRRLARLDQGRDVIGQNRRGWRHVVVVAAVLVIQQHEESARPQRRRAHRLHHLGQQRLADHDVLRVLLRLGEVVRVEEAERRQGARRGVGEEFRERLVGAGPRSPRR